MDDGHALSRYGEVGAKARIGRIMQLVLEPQLVEGVPRCGAVAPYPGTNFEKHKEQALIAEAKDSYVGTAEGDPTAMSIIHFITHPDVVIDPCVPVPLWPLAPEGVRRMRLALDRPWMSQVGSVFSSAERKATDAARIVAGRFGLSPVVVAALGENDRSATGYLPKAEFEATADSFFAYPTESVRGWERAVDAQRRIVGAIEVVIGSAPPTGDVAVISHGGVGALLLCHLKHVPISRAEDQPGAGGGCVYSFDIGTRALLSGWRPIEVATSDTLPYRRDRAHAPR